MTLCSLRTSNFKYLEESAGFYEAIHVRGYLEGAGLEAARERFMARLVLVNLFLGRTERAILLAQGSTAMQRLCAGARRQAQRFQFPTDLSSSFPHALILAGRELSLRYCWLHMLLDRTAPAVPRTVLQAPSFAEAMAAAAALLCRHQRLLVWADSDAESILLASDLEPFRQRGHEICFITPGLQHDDPLIQHIVRFIYSISI